MYASGALPWSDLSESVGLEFQSLTLHWNSLPAEVSPAAKNPKNYHKNRYNNILPFESTRVKLQRTDTCSDEDSEYINASFIDGLTAEDKKQYISCQAPVTSTINDFWRMVWEQNSGIIVMLTRIIENEKIKADVYWPEEEGEIKVYGKISVCFANMYISPDRSIITRRFLVTSEGFNEREVFQLHFCDWPDFGVPGTTHSILRLCDALSQLKERAKKSGLTGPAVVHCSAGVGRTGTFIAIHLACMNWEKLVMGGSCHIVLRTVHHLRLQRRGMVQTGEQYLFIYRAILEYLRQSLVKNIRNATEETINSYLNSLLQYFTSNLSRETTVVVGACADESNSDSPDSSNNLDCFSDEDD